MKRKSKKQREVIAMSLPKKDVRAKVLPEAHVILQMHAIARGESMEKVVSDILNAACLGIGYTEKIAAERMHRLGLLGRVGETREQ